MRYDVTDVRLAEVLATSEALTLPQMRAKKMRVDASGFAKGLFVRTDREKVQQIVVNLLSNAVKFTESGGAITVSARVADSDGVA